MIYPGNSTNPGLIKCFDGLQDALWRDLCIGHMHVYYFGWFVCFWSRFSRNKRSKSSKMIKINVIKPLDNAKTSFKVYKSAIRRKLREIFASQYPNITYNLRAYEIENLPSGIHSHDTEKWTKMTSVKLMKWYRSSGLFRGKPLLKLFIL